MSKILVADDDIQARTFCYDALTQEGCRVLTCLVSEKVLELVKQEKPDLVVMDLQALADKENLLLLFSALTAKVPTVVFSRKITPELEKQAYQDGAIDVIPKGIGAADFKLQIQKILNAKHRLYGESKKAQNLKILIVDDEPEIGEFLADFFEQKGLQTFQARSGEQALLIFERERPAAILLDISMPGMDGILTLKKIREKDAHVTVLMVTSLNDEASMKQALALGAFAYVLKPFDLQYLELVVLSRIMMSGPPAA